MIVTLLLVQANNVGANVYNLVNNLFGVLCLRAGRFSHIRDRVIHSLLEGGAHANDRRRKRKKKKNYKSPICIMVIS